MAQLMKNGLCESFSQLISSKLISLYFITQCSFLVLVILLFFNKLVAAQPAIRIENIVQQPSVTQDETRATAQRLLEEGFELYRQGTAESQRQAIAKFEELLVLWRQAGDKKLEALTLNNIGFVYSALGEHLKALKYYNQALSLVRVIGESSGEAATLNNIGSIYDNLGEHLKALEYYKQALPLFHALGDKNGKATTFNNIGSIYDNLGEHLKALEYYKQALPLFHALGDKNGEATTFNNIGANYYDSGEHLKALEYYNQALLLFRKVNDRRGESTTLTSVALIYLNLGENHKALEYYNQALTLLLAVGDKGRDTAATLYNIGDIYLNLGEKQKALEYYSQALPLFHNLGDSSGEANTLNNIGRVYSGLEEKNKALEYYNQALRLFHTLGDRSGKATTLNNIGVVYDSLGEKQKALKYYNQALLQLREVGNKSKEATILNGIGAVYYDLGDKQKALKYYNQALPLRRAIGDRRGEAVTLNNIGVVYNDLGDKQKALDYYNQALPLRRAIGDKSGEGSTLSNIGAVYYDLGDKEKALEYYNQALPLRRAIGDRNGLAITFHNISAAYYDLGEKHKALKYLNKALRELRAVGNRGGEATTLANIGLVLRDNKQPVKAIKYWEQSATITLQLRSGVGRENRKIFLENNQGTAVGLIDLLIEQNQAERAFEWANLATVADLADYSRLVKAKVANPQAQKAINEWNQKNIRLENLRKNLQEKFSPELSQRVNQLQEKLNQEAEEIRNRFSEVADLFETKPTDIAKLRASVLPGTTVIQPVLLTNIQNVPDTIALFVLTTDKLIVKKIPINPTKFNTLLTQTNASLTNRFDDKYLDNLEQLYDLIIRPIEATIKTTKPKQLSFIASGKLRYIPFETLYDSKADKYLIEKLPISYLTRISPNSLAAKTLKTQSSKRILAIGNPKPNGKLALQGAETEVNKITEIFPGSEAFINNQATLNTFKIQSPRFSLLHLATHGCFQKGGCPELGLEENTLLFADKKFNIRDAALLGLQNTELITLSACQTALQTESNGEEISGLAYLFERAGAKATIASLWSVEDKTTQAIMVEFYQNIKTGMSKDEALRQAKLSEIDSHPFFWSAFVLIGDAR